jgi:hypothetical protein
MSRTVAVIVHALISLAAGAMYFFFVLPRWWELQGDLSSTWGLVLRIVTGVLIGLAALPVLFTWLRVRRPEYGTPELALRLLMCSIALHVVSAVVIIATAIAEIWLKLDDAGQWIFGAYGAAAAIGLLGIFSFYLAFVAERPPPPPRPLNETERKSRWWRRKRDLDRGERSDGTASEPESAVAAEDDEDVKPEKTWGEQVPDDDAEELEKPVPVTEAEDETVEVKTPAEDVSGTTDDETAPSDDVAADSKAAKNGTAADDAPADDAPADDEAPDEDTVASGTSRGGIRNRRPAGKIRRSRRIRKSDSGVAVEDD